MVFHGLPIKNGGSFHGYVSHNQMVNQDEIHGMVRGSDPRQNIQNANLERALTALTNKMGTFGKTLLWRRTWRIFDPKNLRVLLGETTDITSAFPDFEAACRCMVLSEICST